MVDRTRRYRKTSQIGLRSYSIKLCKALGLLIVNAEQVKEMDCAGESDSALIWLFHGRSAVIS